VDGDILAWNRTNVHCILRLSDKSKSPLVSLLPLADLLLSLHEDGSVCVWDGIGAVKFKGGPMADTSSLLLARHTIPPSLGQPTSFLHPDTYINKVAIGTAEGAVVILNFRSGAIIHVCKVLPPGTPVTALAQSPVVDVVGVGVSFFI